MTTKELRKTSLESIKLISYLIFCQNKIPTLFKGIQKNSSPNNVKFNIKHLIKIIKCAKKQENVMHKQKKKISR